jgi:hypothetical protein
MSGALFGLIVAAAGLALSAPAWLPVLLLCGCV